MIVKISTLSMVTFALWTMVLVVEFSTTPLHENTNGYEFSVGQLQNSAERELTNLGNAEEINNQTSSSNSHKNLFDNNDIAQLRTRSRERRKRERLQVIKSQVLHHLRVNQNHKRSNIDSNFFNEKEQQQIADIIRKVNEVNNNSENSIRNGHILENGHRQSSIEYERISSNLTSDKVRPFQSHMGMQWLQSFYPTCILQEHTDREVWELPDTLRLRFNLPLNRYTQNADIVVLLAKLRLFKISKTMISQFRESYPMGDNKSDIHISVYQFLRPLRINKKERKRLIDTKTVLLSKEGWIEFDMASSINYFIHHNHRNYGFDVQVEDKKGNRLNPNLFFKNFNCTSLNTETLRPPFPNLRSIYPELIGESELPQLNSEPYPTFDLHITDATYAPSRGHFRQIPNYSLQSVTASTSTQDSEKQDRIKKRHLDHCRHRCHKVTSFVTFSELGLGKLVIAPEGINWTSCSGSRTTSGIISVGQINSINSRSHYASKYTFGNMNREQEEPSCVPSKWESLPILRVNSDKIQFTIMKNFMPTECSCRTS